MIQRKSTKNYIPREQITFTHRAVSISALVFLLAHRTKGFERETKKRDVGKTTPNAMSCSSLELSYLVSS